MTQSKDQLVWNMFIEARKEILESQKIRSQIIGFKITSVSAGIGLIAANTDKGVPPVLLVIPAIAAVFFDLLITSYSFAIKRTGYYCREHIEPVIKRYQGSEKFLLWEEFMNKKEYKHPLSLIGNIGITVLTMAPAIYVLLKHSPLACWLSWLIILLLVFLLGYDIWEYYLPRRKFKRDISAQPIESEKAQK